MPSSWDHALEPDYGFWPYCPGCGKYMNLDSPTSAESRACPLCGLRIFPSPCSCSGGGRAGRCKEPAIARHTFTSYTDRARSRTNNRTRYVCRKHAENVAKKHGLEVPNA